MDALCKFEDSSIEDEVENTITNAFFFDPTDVIAFNTFIRDGEKFMTLRFASLGNYEIEFKQEIAAVLTAIFDRRQELLMKQQNK